MAQPYPQPARLPQARLVGWGVWLPESSSWLLSHDGSKLIAFMRHNDANRAALDYDRIFGPLQCEPRPLYQTEPPNE